MPIDLMALDAEHAARADKAGLPVTSIDRAAINARLQRSQDTARARLARPGGPAAAPMFIVTRPRADRYVYVLLSQLRDVDADAARAGREWYDANRENLTVDQGSDWINRIKAKIEHAKRNPNTASVEVTNTPDVPKANVWEEWRNVAAEVAAHGGPTGTRFAVPTEAGAVNTLAFWWIVPGRNRHAGKFWIRQVIGGRGATRVRMSPEAMISIARKAIDGPGGVGGAMATYGREIGSCGACGRELTNDESRARGIGPDCLAKGRG